MELYPLFKRNTFINDSSHKCCYSLREHKMEKITLLSHQQTPPPLLSSLFNGKNYVKMTYEFKRLKLIFIDVRICKNTESINSSIKCYF